MTDIYPKYYKKFRCIADKCPDTCCAGWEVVVDAASEELYRKNTSPTGEKLRRVMMTDGDGDTVFRSENGRCPFLMKSGLCELYIQLGEESLCNTCKRFPRFECVLGSRRETGLSVSCPEAARLIFEDETPAEFEICESSELPEPNSIDPTVYYTMLKTQKTAIDILSDEKFSICERIEKFLLLCSQVQAQLDFRREEQVKTPHKPEYSAKKCVEKIFFDLRSLERLDSEWDKALTAGSGVRSEAVREMLCGKYDGEYERLLIYLVFRYFMTAAFDGELLIKAKLFVVAFIAALHIQAGLECKTKEERVRVIQKFSKETEHSAENLERLCTLAKNSGYYSLTNLINAIKIREDKNGIL